MTADATSSAVRRFTSGWDPPRPDVDLQAAVSEVRPDGDETFVQDGWFRGVERGLATTANNIFMQLSALLEPIPTFLASDVQRVPAGEFAEADIPLCFEGTSTGPARGSGSRWRRPTQRAHLVLQLAAAADGHRDRIDRVLREHAVEPDPLRRAGCERADRLGAVPEPARRAAPAVRRGREPHGERLIVERGTADVAMPRSGPQALARGSATS